MTVFKALLTACLSLQQFQSTSGFYMPGVKAQTFQKGEEVEMKVNAITSIHTQIPKPYYRLPFCQPENGPEMASENLGEFITGNKVQNSPYTIYMLQEAYCKKLCQKTLTPLESRLLKMHIARAYHNNWIIDNLPSASMGLTEGGMRQKHYAGGFPIGFIDAKSGKNKEAYIFNHVNIMLDYHQPEGSDGYRVVGFTVEPLSIDHEFVGGYQWDGESAEGFNKMLSTCKNDEHMSRDDISNNQKVTPGATILYTYDVKWTSSSKAWSSRWDVYLNEEGLVPPQVHWYSISNSIFVVLFLSLLVVSILARNLKRDIAGYNAVSQLADDEELDDEVDESGWKLVHADVFRPPATMPMLYCVMVGSGVQLTISTVCTIGLSAIGFLNPSRRGSMMNATLVTYMLCGCVAGYVSSRLYKSFRGRAWQLCTVCTAVLFPGFCFAVFLFFNTVLAFYRSSGSAPFLDILILATMWCCVSVPLCFVGAFFGYKKEPMKFPTVTSTIARAIPKPSTMLLDPKVCIAMAGIVPFASAYVELFFIMSSLWMNQYYYVFGFTFIVFVILLISSAEMTVLFVYYQLVCENHRWWWFSFVAGGSVAAYFFGYSMIWFRSLEASKMFFTYLLYFGYMFLLCLALFLVAGSFAALVSLWFVRKMFSSIKVD